MKTGAGKDLPSRVNIISSRCGIRTLVIQAAFCSVLITPPLSFAQAQEATEMESHHDRSMALDSRGMVMNNNQTELPRDCSALAGTVELTVYAGTDYARAYPGNVLPLPNHSGRPCNGV